MGITPRNGGSPQTLPTITYGWGKTFYDTNNVNGFYWNMLTNFLYTQTPTEQFNVFLNVPLNVAQQFAFTTTPDQFYDNVVGNFKHCLLTESCVPITTDDGTYLIP